MRLIAVLLALCMSCAPAPELRLIDDLPRDLYASPSPPPSEAKAVAEYRVYFVRANLLEARVRLASSGTDAATLAVQDLFVGPSPEEVAQGLTSAIPDGAEVLGVSTIGDLVTVDLSKEFELSAAQEVLVLRLAQVVYTLSDLPSITRVRFMIDSHSVAVIDDSGILRNTPVGRENYPSLEGPGPLS